MSFFKNGIPTCGDCKHADLYIPYWTYPYGEPKCSIHHKDINPDGIVCENFKGMGKFAMMSLVKFKQEYYDPIVNGVKTQTMRMPQKRLDVGEEELCVGIFPNGEEVLLKIRKVGYKSFKSISDEDADREGFSSAEELKNVLCEIYKDYSIMDSSRFYYYQFEFMGKKR